MRYARRGRQGEGGKEREARRGRQGEGGKERDHRGMLKLDFSTS